jgi:ribosomal protein L21E
MSNFQIGDKVKIRPDADSQFRGRTGTIVNLPNLYSKIPGYKVKIETTGFSSTCQILEKDLEALK